MGISVVWDCCCWLGWGKRRCHPPRWRVEDTRWLSAPVVFGCLDKGGRGVWLCVTVSVNFKLFLYICSGYS